MVSGIFSSIGGVLNKETLKNVTNSTMIHNLTDEIKRGKTMAEIAEERLKKEMAMNQSS
jgi:hypothetical protein